MRFIYGVGIKDSDYVVEKREPDHSARNSSGRYKQKVVWRCPFYTTWKSMIERCYSARYKERHPTYKTCSVTEEWLTFSNFKSWMEQQDWEGKELDKDLLFRHNKLYSPETCLFVARVVNSFIVERDASRGEYPIGVYWDKKNSKFMARCQNPITKKYDYLGRFDDPNVAHKAWLSKKLEIANVLADNEDDVRVATALRGRYVNY